MSWLLLALLVVGVPAPFAAAAPEESAECSLPFGEQTPEAAARRIAETTAWLQALEKMAESAPASSLIRLGAEDMAGRQALAGMLCASAVSSTIRQERMYAQARLRLSQQESDALRRRLPHEKELPRLYAELLQRQREKAEEARGLLAALPGDSAYGARIALLADQLDALGELGRLLPQRAYGRWPAPRTALPVLQRAAKLDPDLALPLHLLGEALLQLDRPQDALAALDRALALHPERAGAFYTRGLVHLRLQLPTLAERDLSAALAHDASQAAWWRARGVLHMIRNETDMMCGDFLQACTRGDCEGLARARERGECMVK